MGFDPVEDGHPDIHYHRVGPQPHRRDDRVGTEMRRYIGLDILAKSRMNATTANKAEEVT